MKLRHLFLPFAILVTISGIVDAQQPHDPAQNKAIATSVKGDLAWYDLQKQSRPVLEGQAWASEQKGTYGRLPVRAKEKIRSDVWSLSEQGAGLSVRFRTNGSEIRVSYQVSGGQAFPHMPATGVSGLDLYTVNEHGKSLWSGGNYTFSDTVKYIFKNLTSFQDGSKSREYQLFLPLYNQVKWMEIGIAHEAELTWTPLSTEKPIVVYGTSIAQGGCASRPGMAWTTIVERDLCFPLINLGFSGNGMLEKEVLNFINEIDARLYILDCLPNLVSRPAPEIETATIEAVHQIRTVHQSPILLVEHPGYTDGPVSKEKFESYSRANKSSKSAFDQLKRQGVTNIFYLSCKEINMPMDGMVDGIHPSDYGMRSYADAYEKMIRKILRK